LADANYRPQRLPYSSVIGPLNLEVEPDRDLPATAYIFAQSPGYLAGRDGQDGNPVPAPGQLHLTVDGITEIAVAIDFGADAGDPLTDATGRRVARVMTAAVAAAIDAGEAREDGVAVADPERLDELRRIAVRWQSGRNRFVIRSGRSAVVNDTDRIAGVPASGMALRAGPQDLADALGLRGDGTLEVPGRIARHRISQPTAVAIDARFDLWAGGQQHLADLLERWAILTPTRGQLPVCPGALHSSVEARSSRIRVLPGAWPAERWTLAHIDFAGGAENRVDSRAMDIDGGAIAGDHLELDGAETARVDIWEAEALPPPDRPDHPAPSGYAMMVHCSVASALADGDAVQIAALNTDGGTALSLGLRVRTRNGDLEAVIEARADRAEGGTFAPRDFLLAPDSLAEDLMLHVVLEAPTGRLTVYADGTPLPLDDSAPPAPQVSGQALGGEDMPLVLGNPGGNTRPLRIRRLELLARPLGPVDPRLPATTARADRWAIGDPVGLAKSYDGRETLDSFTAVVVGIEGDTLVLDRPVPRAYDRARTVVFKRALFFSQRQWRRRDDLMNRLYRLSAEYRISAFLDDRLPSNTAPIVEFPDVEIRDLSLHLAGLRAAEAGEEAVPPLPPLSTHPGVTTEFVVAAPPQETSTTETS